MASSISPPKNAIRAVERRGREGLAASDPQPDRGRPWRYDLGQADYQEKSSEAVLKTVL